HLRYGAPALMHYGTEHGPAQSIGLIVTALGYGAPDRSNQLLKRGCDLSTNLIIFTMKIATFVDILQHIFETKHHGKTATHFAAPPCGASQFRLFVG
ncbi:MAG: hypothetical protein K2G78_03885, partial [Muribaculaceae bacterium]|nr:hypothetical protein [Muribaculaceae bacterium]